MSDYARMLLVERVPKERVHQVVSVFCDAFYHYPVFRYVLGADNPDYTSQLQKLIGLFVLNRVLRNDAIFGIADEGRLIAAATTSIPDEQPPHPDFTAARAAVWKELGAAALERYERCVAAWQPVSVSVPQIHVNMIGVEHARQGIGLAGKLMNAIHELSSALPTSRGVSLTTEDPRNVHFYQHLGYEVVGSSQIDSDITTWGFFRRNDR